MVMNLLETLIAMSKDERKDEIAAMTAGRKFDELMALMRGYTVEDVSRDGSGKWCWRKPAPAPGYLGVNCNPPKVTTDPAAFDEFWNWLRGRVRDMRLWCNKDFYSFSLSSSIGTDGHPLSLEYSQCWDHQGSDKFEAVAKAALTWWCDTHQKDNSND